jgi:hypothetical protein
MGFVVKAAGPGLGVRWLAPGPDGSYTFGSRKNAMVFLTPAQTQDAAAKASESLGRLGMSFTVESTD